VKAKNDASMVAMGLINFQKDVGADALTFGSAVAAVSQTLRLPDVLASEGSAPSVEGTDSDDAEVTLPLLAAPGQERGSQLRLERSSMRAQRRRWREVGTGALDDHLVTNRRGYRYRRPGEYGGWNGPYVSAQIKGDPWGNQYMINSHWLDGGSSTADSQGQPRRAVFVITAGANGVIETPFEQSIVDAHVYGDDIVIRIQ
jgi:hypothetical protein